MEYRKGKVQSSLHMLQAWVVKKRPRMCFKKEKVNQCRSVEKRKNVEDHAIS